MSTIEAPFVIGQRWWAPRVHPVQVVVPCPVCFGQLAITVVLGNGEELGVPCEACGKGFSGPLGTITEWDHAPAVSEFVIAGVKSMHADRWWLVSTTGAEVLFDDLRATEAEAMAESEKRCAENHERNMRSHQHSRRATKDAGWSVQYHRRQIADLERRIAWHQSKLLTGPRRKKAALETMA